MMRSISVLCMLFVLAGCDQEQDEDEGEPTFTSYGQVETSGNGSPELRDSFSSVLMGSGLRDSASLHQIYLSTERPPFDGPAAPWALTIRTDTRDPAGEYDASSLDLHLFADYHNDCCLNQQDPFGAYETYSRAFVAVGGSVTFESRYRGWIDVTVQEESPARSGSTFGPTFRLRACWHIAGEGRVSGCDL
jgi:hypothetical protein